MKRNASSLICKGENTKKKKEKERSKAKNASIEIYRTIAYIPYFLLFNSLFFSLVALNNVKNQVVNFDII
jgi:hypothetical protein